MPRKTNVSKKNNPGKSTEGISEARKRSLANLRPPFKPGQSGNPKGRPKGLLDMRTRVSMAIERLAEEYVAQHNKKNPKKQITTDDVDIWGDIFAQYVNKARNGDQKAMDSLLDRVYGKATQPVELGHIEDDELNQLEIEKSKMKILEWQKGWEKIGVKSGNKKYASKPTPGGNRGNIKK